MKGYRWVPMAKELRQDRRVHRIAARLPGHAGALHAVTLVIGGLYQLWAYADSFADDEDMITATLDEVDQIAGIPGFAELLPADWLEVVDAERVKLPGFHAHNGTEARAKAMTARRVARHRAGKKRSAVTDSNGSPLGEQSRAEHNRTLGEGAALSLPLVVPGLDSGAWEKWSGYRVAIRKPLRPVSVPQAQRQMAELGARQMEAVEYTIGKGWTGLRLPDPRETRSREPDGVDWRPTE